MINIRIERAIRNPDYQRFYQEYLTYILLGLSLATLLISELYNEYQLRKYKDLEDHAVRVKDISEVWPENEGKMVFIQGFMRLG